MKKLVRCLCVWLIAFSVFHVPAEAETANSLAAMSAIPGLPADLKAGIQEAVQRGNVTGLEVPAGLSSGALGRQLSGEGGGRTS